MLFLTERSLGALRLTLCVIVILSAPGRILKNKPLDQINKEANRLAAFVCTQRGAVPELPASLTA